MRALNLELRDWLGQSWALQHARKRRNQASAATGNRRAILPIPHESCTELSRAAVDDGKSGDSNQRRQLPLEQFVSQAKFTSPAGIEAEIEAPTRALVP